MPSVGNERENTDERFVAHQAAMRVVIDRGLLHDRQLSFQVVNEVSR